MISLARRDAAVRARFSRDESGGGVDRVLIAAGVDPRVIASVRQDLMDEYEVRFARDGALAARTWYLREGVCSLFALVRYAMNASPRTRHIAAVAIALLAGSTVLTVQARRGAPDQILLNMPTLDGAVVVNALDGEQIRARVIDARGHELGPRNLRFQIRVGRSISISPTGQVDCRANEDAVVRAFVGSLEANFPVACRPVRTLSADHAVNVIAGGGLEPLPFAARDNNGRSVQMLRGSAHVHDTTIATIADGQVRGIRPGQTTLDVYIGNQVAQIRVVVHSVVAQFTIDSHAPQFQAIPIRISAGDAHRWALPRGAFWVRFIPRSPGASSPHIEVVGARCVSPSEQQRQYIVADTNTAFCIVKNSDAYAIVKAEGDVDGALAIEREVDPRRLP